MESRILGLTVPAAVFGPALMVLFETAPSEVEPMTWVGVALTSFALAIALRGHRDGEL